MTLDELIQACRVRGPWHLEYGRIRNPRHDCPLWAVDFGANLIRGADRGVIITAADNREGHDPAIRAALLTLVEP